MRADGNDPVRLTNNGVYDVQPAYSPDGTRIAYETREDGDREVYVRHATAGGAAANVTNTAGGVTDEQPDWGWGGPPAPPPPSPPGNGPGGGSEPPAGLGDPTLGVDVIVEPVAGTVLVAIDGRSFARLTEPRRVPVGSLVDSRTGKVRVISATGKAGGRQSGTFSGSLFQIRQSKKRGAKGLTELVLKGSSFRACGTRGASASRRTIRRMRASARGRFKVIARNSSATVSATVWQMDDRCDGTLTKVRRGRLVVRDLRRRRNVNLKAGQAYLAKMRS